MKNLPISGLSQGLRDMIRDERSEIQAAWAASSKRGTTVPKNGSDAAARGFATGQSDETAGEARPEFVAAAASSAADPNFAEVVFDDALEVVSPSLRHDDTDDAALHSQVVDMFFFNDFDDDFDDGGV